MLNKILPNLNVKPSIPTEFVYRILLSNYLTLYATNKHTEIKKYINPNNCLLNQNEVWKDKKRNRKRTSNYFSNYKIDKLSNSGVEHGKYYKSILKFLICFPIILF